MPLALSRRATSRPAWMVGSETASVLIIGAYPQTSGTFAEGFLFNGSPNTATA
jgi:hypothetical protein